MRLGHHDGQSMQAQVILAMLHHKTELTESDLSHNLSVYPYFNGRERGYSLNLVHFGKGDLHILFYEYRSSDVLCVDYFEGVLMNPPTVRDASEAFNRGDATSKSFKAFDYEGAVNYIVKTVRSHVYGDEDE